MPVKRSPIHKPKLRSGHRNPPASNMNEESQDERTSDVNAEDEFEGFQLDDDAGAVGGSAITQEADREKTPEVQDTNNTSQLQEILKVLVAEQFQRILPEMLKTAVSEVMSGGDKFNSAIEAQPSPEKMLDKEKGISIDKEKYPLGILPSVYKAPQRSRSSDPPRNKEQQKGESVLIQGNNGGGNVIQSTGAISKRKVLTNWREPRKPEKQEYQHHSENIKPQKKFERREDEYRPVEHQGEIYYHPANEQPFQPIANTEYDHSEVSKIIRGWGLKYDGEKTSMPVGDFFFRVETHRRRDLLSGRQVLDNFHLMIGGKADDFYWQTLRHNRARGVQFTWEELKNLFFKEFQTYRSGIGLMRDLMNLRQGRDENFNALYKRFSQLHDHLHTAMEEREIVELLRGSLREDISSLIFAAEIKNVEQLRNLVQRAETQISQKRNQWGTIQRRISELSVEENESQTRTTYRPRPRPRKARIAKWICWNCDETGHGYMTCAKERRLFCYKCGEKEVTCLNCPKCRQGNRRASGSWTGPNHLQTATPVTQNQPQQPDPEQ